MLAVLRPPSLLHCSTYNMNLRMHVNRTDSDGADANGFRTDQLIGSIQT